MGRFSLGRCTQRPYRPIVNGVIFIRITQKANLLLQPLKDNLTEVRQSLEKHLLWTSYDFIRHQPDFFEKDKAREAAALTEVLAPENDLRFRYQDDGLDIVFLAERLPWDSDFFGVETAKLHMIHPMNTAYDTTRDYHVAMGLFVEEMRQRGVKYLLAPIFPEDLAGLRALGGAGFELITSLNCYHVSVQDYTHPQRYDARLATPDDVQSLAETARDEVNPYDRFHADPFITPDDAARMMQPPFQMRAVSPRSRL